MQTPKPTKVFIADDHQIMVDGIKTMLQATNHVTVLGHANDGEEVMAYLRTHANQVDVAILDINMPKLNGVEVTRQIRKKYPDLKVLILTMYNEVEFVRNMAEVGAHGFILKNAGRDEMLIALDLLMEGQTYFSQEVTKTLIKSYEKGQQSNNVVITSREAEVIGLLADGLTSKEISEKLFISPHTVETHRKNLLSKTEMKTTAGMIKYAIDMGII